MGDETTREEEPARVAVSENETDSSESLASGDLERPTRSRSNAFSEGPSRPRSNAISEEAQFSIEVLEEEMGGVRTEEISSSGSGGASVPKKVTENIGLIKMAMHSGTILGKKAIWDSFNPEINKSELAVTAGGLTASVVSTGSSAGMALDGTAEETAKRVEETGDKNAVAEQAAGEIAASVGSSISLLFSTIKGISKMMEAYKGKDGMKALESSREFAAAIKSGFELANSIIKYTSGFANPAIVSVIPGLGIAISACDIIINAHNVFMAHSAKVSMSEVSDKYKSQMVAIFGESPEKALPELFHKEKRGKFGQRITYLRLQPGKMAELSQIASITDYSQLELAELQRRYKLPEGTSFQDFYLAVKYYELGSKMEEINQKREVYSGRNITTAIISIAGDIASFFPADGGITAGVLKGVAGGTQAAFAAGKFIQGKARDFGVLGGDTTRSAKAKYQEYVGHTKTIYMLLESEGLKPNTELEEVEVDTVNDLINVERIIKATGASTKALYKTNYGSDSGIRSQIELLINGMKSGR